MNTVMLVEFDRRSQFFKKKYSDQLKEMAKLNIIYHKFHNCIIAVFFYCYRRLI